MNIKSLLLTMILASSSLQSQSDSRLVMSPESKKYFDRVNQRFILNGDHSLEQVSSYLSGIKTDFNNIPENDNWLINDYTFQRWNSFSWQNDSNRVYGYNQNNLISELKIRDWAGNQWINECRYLYQYDQYLRINTQKYQVYLSNSWTDSLKAVYEYNQQGLLSTETTYRWNNPVWEYCELMTSIYSNHRLIEDIYQYWNGTYWENSDRTVYEYSQNSVNITFDLWLFQTWINFMRITIYYNEYGFLNELMIQMYIPFIGWQNLTRILFTYDSNFKIVEALNQDWDSDISEWVNYARITTTYTTENLPQNDLKELWSSNSYWTNDFLTTYHYDEFRNRTESTGQSWNGTTWTNSERELFSYIEPTGIKANVPDAEEYKLIGNYPNPFNPATTIIFQLPELSIVTLKIYNSTGEEVTILISDELPAGTYKILWNAVGLPSGVYFYQLKTDGYVGTRKMILIK